MIRCNNCYTVFLSDEELSIGKDSVDKNEITKQCHICETDSYLMDLEPLNKDQKLRIWEYGCQDKTLFTITKAEFEKEHIFIEKIQQIWAKEGEIIHNYSYDEEVIYYIDKDGNSLSYPIFAEKIGA